MVVVVRDNQRDDAATAGIGIAAPAGIAKGEVALIPGDKDRGIAIPGPRVHNLIHGCLQESIAERDKLLLVVVIAGIVRV